MVVKPIALSFKNTPEDTELYTWITSHSNMSGFIKDTLRAVKINESNGPKPLQETKENNLIDMDF
jgi:hypothetical protein